MSSSKVNVSPEVLHKDFEDLLLNITPSADIVQGAKTLALELYNKHFTDINSSKASKQNRISAINREKEQVFDTLVKSTNESIKSMCEAKVYELDSEKGKLEAEMENTRTEIMPFDEAFSYVEGFITNPLNVWRNGDLSVRRLVPDLVFGNKLIYDKVGKFGDYGITPLFQFFGINPITIWHKNNHFLDQVVPQSTFISEFLGGLKKECGTNDFPQKTGEYSFFLDKNEEMVPQARIGLAPRPYQGRVLPLYYWGGIGGKQEKKSEPFCGLPAENLS